MLDEIKKNSRISYSEFLERFPPFVRNQYIKNIEKQGKIISKEKIGVFLEFINLIVWVRCQNPEIVGERRWRDMHNGLINLHIDTGLPSNKEYVLNFNDYWCRKKVYETIIKDLEKNDIFIKDLEGFQISFA
jgi:hypothetical protein